MPPRTGRRGRPAAPQPFLKWAGGKRRLLPEIAASLPPRFGRYIEPFLGGGAVMFHVLSERPCTACSASDANPELVCTYEAVRDKVEQVIRLLELHAEQYAAAPADFYYAVRSESPAGKAERAARMLFLNRTCFNGLYRVNGGGRFNVPFCRYKSPNIVNACALRAASAILSSAAPSIACRDFEDAAAEASRGDLVYMDPPYPRRARRRALRHTREAALPPATWRGSPPRAAPLTAGDAASSSQARTPPSRAGCSAAVDGGAGALPPPA